MYCTKCGTQNNDKDIFCSNCGNKINRILEEKKDVTFADVIISDKEILNYTSAVDSTMGDKEQVDSDVFSLKKKSKIFWISTGLLLVVISFFTIIIGMNSGRDNDLENTNSSAINGDFQIVIEPQFDEIHDFSANELAAVRSGDNSTGKWGFINIDGKYVVEPSFNYAFSFAKNGLAAVQIGEKWGFINRIGEFIIEPNFDLTFGFNEYDQAWVMVANKWGLINEKGDYVIEPLFDHAWNFSENGLASVLMGERWGYVNRKGDIIIKAQFDLSSSFSVNGLAPVKVGEKWGVINEKGNLVIEPKFDFVLPFHTSSLAAVRIGDESIPKWGFINEKGEYAIDPHYDFAWNFAKNGLAGVKIGEKWGYLNIEGEFVIKPIFDDARTFDEHGLALVKIDKKWGFINEVGEFVIEPNFENAENFTENGLARVQTGGKWGYIRPINKLLITNKYKKIVQEPKEEIELIVEDEVGQIAEYQSALDVLGRDLDLNDPKDINIAGMELYDKGMFDLASVIFYQGTKLESSSNDTNNLALCNYNLACSLALLYANGELNNIDSIIIHLDNSYRLNVDRIVRSMNDPDFDVIRNSSEYNNLLAKYGFGSENDQKSVLKFSDYFSKRKMIKLFDGGYENGGSMDLTVYLEDDNVVKLSGSSGWVGISRYRITDGNVLRVFSKEIEDTDSIINYKNVLELTENTHDYLFGSDLFLGSSWTDEQNSIYTVTGIDMKIELADHIFNSIEITVEGDYGTIKQYYGEGVGLIAIFSDFSMMNEKLIYFSESTSLFDKLNIHELTDYYSKLLFKILYD